MHRVKEKKAVCAYVCVGIIIMEQSSSNITIVIAAYYVLERLFSGGENGEKEQGSALSVVVLQKEGAYCGKEGWFRGMRKERAPSTMHIGRFYWINRV